MAAMTMDPLDELRIGYRRLKARHLEVTAARRSELTNRLLNQVRSFFQEMGFEVFGIDEGLKAALATRVILLQADGEDDVRIGEFLGFTFTDSLEDNKPQRIIAQLQPGSLPEHAPMDVNTQESIQAQIDYMEALLAEGMRSLQGFEIKETMTMASYREPQPGSERRLFASIEEAISCLLADRRPVTPG